MYTIIHCSDTPADFLWDISPPFEIVPSSGTLAVKETCQLDAIFSPTVSSDKIQANRITWAVYTVCVVCTYLYCVGLCTQWSR